MSVNQKDMDFKMACEMLASNNRIISELHATQGELVKALESMLNIFDREGASPRLKGLSIGAMTCDQARETLKLAKP